MSIVHERFAVIFVSGLALAAPEPQALERRQVASVAKSVAGEVTSDAGSVFTQATSVGASFASKATSVGGDVATHVTSIGGQVYTEITSIGGSVITLATSGAGVECGCGEYRPLHISVPVLAALATTAGGVLFGAWVAV
ncbi:hypothetical protein BJV77DRAFT_1040676 [Russula vinacea]|nr:hypothetical protein BJV77DRAFT_1040676 [Russula vinacea]